MSTDITVVVGSPGVLERNKQQQAANRNQFIEAQQVKAVEAAASEAAADAAQAQRLANEGAVPEYGIVPETSAQRRLVGGGAWLDVNVIRADTVPTAGSATAWIEDDAIQVSVAPGSGQEWASATINGEFTDKQIDPGTGATGTTYNCFFVILRFFAPRSDEFSLSAFGVTTSIPPDAIVVETDPREELYSNYPTSGVDQGDATLFFPAEQEFEIGLVANSDNSDQDTLASYLVLPVRDSTAIVVATTFQSFARSDRFQPGALGGSPKNTLVNNIEIASGSFAGSGGYDIPGVVQRIYYKYPTSETGGVDAWMPIDGFYAIYNPDYIEGVSPVEETFINNTSEFGLTNSVEFRKGSKRETVAFVVNSQKSRQIDVPTQLRTLLETRFPSMNYSEFGSSNAYSYATLPPAIDEISPFLTWNQAPRAIPAGASNFARRTFYSDTRAFGWNITDDYSPPAMLFGTPAVYDYLENDLNDFAFFDINFTEEIAFNSSYDAGSIPLLAPDPGRAGNVFSWMLSAHEQIVTYNSDNPTTELLWLENDIMFKWAYLKTSQRQEALENYKWERQPINTPAAFLAGTYEFDVQVPLQNAEFTFSLYANTKDEEDNPAIYFAQDVWLPEPSKRIPNPGPDNPYPSVVVENQGWTNFRYNVRLSPLRVLPPSLYANQPGRTLHPYQDIQYTQNPDYSTTKSAGAAHSLCLVAWSAWGLNFTDKLISLGFSSSDLSP